MKYVLMLLLMCLCTVSIAQSPSTVLVVACKNNPDSIALAQKYMGARNVPASNLLLLDTAADENTVKISLADFKSKMVIPIFDKINTLPRIDYILLCRNLPIQVMNTSRSVDSLLVGYQSIDQLKAAKIPVRNNPYYTKTVPFDSHVFGIHLVTRLDGYSWADATALVDNSLASRSDAPILLESSPNMQTGGFGFFDTRIATAADILLKSHMSHVILDNSKTPLIPTFPISGYFSWGSHAQGWNLDKFKQLKFAPGAIGDILFSFSGQSLRFPGAKGSQAAWFIHQGISGIDCTATEPAAAAFADPTMLFPHYLSGMNLAESFYSAIPFVMGMNIIVGDPLATFKGD